MLKVAIFFLISIFNIAQGSNLEELYFDSANKNIYKEISQDEFISLQKCFYTLLSEDNASCLNQYGFKRVDINSSIYAIVDTQRAGHGFYLIRKDTKSNYLLSMPHRFSDEKTGIIGMRLFKENSFKGAFFATATRHTKDMAHNRVTPFNAFHIAYALFYKSSHIYQLHGFSNKKRKSQNGKKAQIILSNGTKRYSDDLLKLSKCLKGSVAPNVYIYGKDIYELGATTNSQIHSLHNIDFFGFTHIEMSYPTRTDLAENKSVRDNFAKCLLEN